MSGSSYEDIKNELEELKKEGDIGFASDPITGTLIKLLEVEKKGKYSRLPGKTKQQEKIIGEGLKRYKERLDANSSN